MLNVANIAACHPNLPKLLMIKLLDPIEIPKTNNRMRSEEHTSELQSH